MTFPTSDTQPSRFQLRRPQITLPTHSMPTQSSESSSPLPSATFSPSRSATGSSKKTEREQMHEDTHAQVQGHAIDFATNSWDLATGGLKTLTAKRELPLPDRLTRDTPPETQVVTRSYAFALIILSCVVLMLIGGGVVLFVMLQP